MRSRSRLPWVWGVLLLVVARAPISAQERAGSAGPVFGVGYVANAPDLFAGGAAYMILPVLGGLGLYVDAKFDTSSRSGEDSFEPGLTANQVDNEIGDDFQDDDTSWRSFNAAIIRPVTPSLMLYAGAGYAEESAYRQYRDETQTRGIGGLYWVESPDEDRTTVNVLAGMFLRMTRRLNAQFGVESAPRGFSVGLSVVLP